MTQEQLTIHDHSRYFKDCRYVYPVVSRRSRGLSLGINLNTNNSCNWRCIYCQVDGLIRSKPDPVDLEILEKELRVMLDWIVNGDFIELFTPVEMRRFNDICLAGNGEPTLSEQFSDVCDLITKLRAEYRIDSQVKTLLITNGSQLHVKSVQESLRKLNTINGEVWFKVDRVDATEIKNVNQINLTIASISERLKICGTLCSTYIQSCWFCIDSAEPSQKSIESFIKFVVEHKAYINGVLLYSVARTPGLPEGKRVSSCSIDFLCNIAKCLDEKSINCNYYM